MRVTSRRAPPSRRRLLVRRAGGIAISRLSLVPSQTQSSLSACCLLSAAFPTFESNAASFPGPDQIGPITGKAMEGTGGKFIIRTNNITDLDGAPPKRFVVIASTAERKANTGTVHP